MFLAFFTHYHTFKAPPFHSLIAHLLSLNNIPSYKYTRGHLSIHLLKDCWLLPGIGNNKWSCCNIMGRVCVDICFQLFCIHTVCPQNVYRLWVILIFSGLNLKNKEAHRLSYQKCTCIHFRGTPCNKEYNYCVVWWEHVLNFVNYPNCPPKVIVPCTF